MRFLSLIHEQIQLFAAKFPTQRNKEFLRAQQGILPVKEQGILAPEQTRLGTNFLTVRVNDNCDPGQAAAHKAQLILAPAQRLTLHGVDLVCE
jgi:hypothetical protein